MQLVRVIQAGVDVDGDGAPDLDASRITYWGWSIGSNYGIGFVAATPEVTAGGVRVDRRPGARAPAPQPGGARRRSAAGSRRARRRCSTARTASPRSTASRCRRRSSTRTSRCATSRRSSTRCRARSRSSSGSSGARGSGATPTRRRTRRSWRRGQCCCTSPAATSATRIRARARSCAPAAWRTRTVQFRHDLFYLTLPPAHAGNASDQAGALVVQRARPSAAAADRARHAGPVGAVPGVWRHRDSADRPAWAPDLRGAHRVAPRRPRLHPMRRPYQGGASAPPLQFDVVGERNCFRGGNRNSTRRHFSVPQSGAASSSFGSNW